MTYLHIQKGRGHDLNPDRLNKLGEADGRRTKVKGRGIILNIS